MFGQTSAPTALVSNIFCTAVGVVTVVVVVLPLSSATTAGIVRLSSKGIICCVYEQKYTNVRIMRPTRNVKYFSDRSSRNRFLSRCSGHDWFNICENVHYVLMKLIQTFHINDLLCEYRFLCLPRLLAGLFVEASSLSTNREIVLSNFYVFVALAFN